MPSKKFNLSMDDIAFNVCRERVSRGWLTLGERRTEGKYSRLLMEDAT